jgi:hypothetical protein
MRRRTILLGAGAAGLTLACPEVRGWAQQTKQGRWLRLESPNFIVYAPNDETKARAEIVALERFHALLSRLMPRKERSPLKLTVYVADSNQDFERAQPGVDKTTAGFYDSSIEQIRAVMAPDRALERQRDMQKNIRAMDGRVVLFHEYAHHFLRANSRRIYPRWYNEGFAEFVSSVSFSDDGLHVGMFTANRAIWLTSGDWLGIDRFLLGEDLSGEDRAMFYAQAWLATHLMFNKPERAAGFDRYCVALQDGGDPIGAFEPAFGLSPQEFDKELRAYKRKSMQIYLMPEEKVDYASSVSVKRLSEAADDLLMPLSYLRAVPPKRVAAQTVAQVSQEARKHQGDAFALRALATELWYGDLSQARMHLDALLLAEPNNADTHHLSGLCDLRAAYKAGDGQLFQRARGAFAAAHRLDETRAASLFRYVECDLFLEKTMTPHMVDVLVAGYRIAPQVDAISLVTAQALIQHQRWDEALFILRPLASAPHGGRTSARAKVYLEAAKTKQQTSFSFFASADRLEQDFE